MNIQYNCERNCDNSHVPLPLKIVYHLRTLSKFQSTNDNGNSQYLIDKILSLTPELHSPSYTICKRR